MVARVPDHLAEGKRITGPLDQCREAFRDQLLAPVVVGRDRNRGTRVGPGVSGRYSGNDELADNTSPARAYLPLGAAARRTA